MSSGNVGGLKHFGNYLGTFRKATKVDSLRWNPESVDRKRAVLLQNVRKKDNARFLYE